MITRACHFVLICIIMKCAHILSPHALQIHFHTVSFHLTRQLPFGLLVHISDFSHACYAHCLIANMYSKTDLPCGLSPFITKFITKITMKTCPKCYAHPQYLTNRTHFSRLVARCLCSWGWLIHNPLIHHGIIGLWHTVVHVGWVQGCRGKVVLCRRHWGRCSQHG